MNRTLDIILTVGVVLSLWLAHYIPADVFDKVLSPALFTVTVTVAFLGAFLVFRHAEGLRVRKVWGNTLLVWGIIDLAYLVSSLVAPSQVMDMGAENLTTHELLLGNLLGWVLLLYPTEALRPGWLSARTVLWQLLPMLALVALDYLIPFNLRPVIALYPFALISFLVYHVHAYRTWCEDNFSTLDKIDVQWIIHYLWMVALVGVVYIYMCMTHSPTRGFTQLCLTIFMFIYATDQILYRPDPWTLVHKRERVHATPEGRLSARNEELRRKLDAWMEREKPYTRPDFLLADLGEVLPMNRTYLSQFIKAEYGCSFYQFVNHLRIEEAKRLKLAHPELKMEEIATRCGFSCRNVFSNVFARETGMSPREWYKKCNPA